MKDPQKNIILAKTRDFSLAVIGYVTQLENRRKYVVSRQLLRSATAIGARVHEAQHAESRADFVHKMKIAAKEASETQYWIFLCENGEGYYPEKNLRTQIDQIAKILSKIITSAKFPLGSQDSVSIDSSPIDESMGNF